ncbi:MAG: DNA cytosine methyltransferase [Nitrosomonas sp.]|nr:DNA cytosine methyltransferase [Nitrosomonas sp.]
MNELALFAGAGGGILGGKLLGWETVCAVEKDRYAASVLCARQNDGFLAPFPVWDDICTFDGRPWRGIVDVVSGGFPCQDISIAGRGAGITGKQSSLWSQMARIVREVRPSFVFMENSPALTFRGLGIVLGDLSEMGFHAEWGVISASEASAPHIRKRIWLVAYADSDGLQRINTSQSTTPVPKWEWADIERVVSEIQQVRQDCIPESWILRNSHGMAGRMDRTKCIGNGQVPQCAALAFNILTS